MKVVLSDQLWCQQHATLVDEGWKCKITGAIIMVAMVGRTLQDGFFPLSGSGAVPLVGHLHCPGCQPDWKPPTYGTQITEEEIADVH